MSNFYLFFFCFLDKFTRNSENSNKWPYNWACVLYYRGDQGNCAEKNNHRFLSLERLGTHHQDRLTDISGKMTINEGSLLTKLSASLITNSYL